MERRPTHGPKSLRRNIIDDFSASTNVGMIKFGNLLRGLLFKTETDSLHPLFAKADTCSGQIQPDFNRRTPRPRRAIAGRTGRPDKNVRVQVAKVICAQAPRKGQFSHAIAAPMPGDSRTAAGRGARLLQRRLGLHHRLVGRGDRPGGLSQGDCRLFMADASYRASFGVEGPIVVWLNLSGRAEVDALHERWSRCGAVIAAPPQPQPYKLYEFLARDIDGNFLRVFYGFGWEEKLEADVPG